EGLRGLRPDRTDAPADREGGGRIGQEVGRGGRDRPALRQGRQGRGDLPRREAHPRPQLRQMPHEQMEAAGRQPRAGRRRAARRPGGKGPATYYSLALDHKAEYGHKPLIASWRGQPTRYLRPFQSRRSLLTWKVYGRRTDGWDNDDFPTETTPGDAKTLRHK